MSLAILAVVTARGGSKRLPGKNLRPLGGRPLIVWSIEVVDGLETVVDTLVSTDDPTIAAVASEAGALVPWLRPAELASDTSSSVDVCLHALDWYEQHRRPVDGLLLLQPTSPFRGRDTVKRGIELFARNERRPVLGVGLATSHPMHCFMLEGQSLRPFFEGGMQPRTQDLPGAYVLNGGFYLIAPHDLRQRRAFYAADALALVSVRPEESIDIDTEWDWRMAEAMLGGQAPP